VNIQSLARPEILAMAPYASARSSAAADGVLLNANEAPVMLLDDPNWRDMALNRYPPPQPEDLRRRLARLYGVDSGQLLVTRGSDEGIDLLLRVFCRPGQDAIIECPPCFGMYRVAAQIQGAAIISVARDADTLRIDMDALVRAIRATKNVKLVFLTSPNNPTGDLIHAAELERLLVACGDHALLVLDEAYIEFSDAESAAGRVARCPQLVVLRTLSKAWAAAGLRCGAVIADPEVVGLLQRVMAPYPLPAPSIEAAMATTGEGMSERQAEMLSMLTNAKARLLERLESRPWIRRIWPGEANFVLARVDDGPALVRHCADRGVRIRDFSGQPLLEGCVRLTVGSPEDMAALEAALDAWGEGHA